MDRVILIQASAIVDVVEFRRVLDRIKPIFRNTTDKCSEYNPKIGPLTDLHTTNRSTALGPVVQSPIKLILD